MTTSRLYNFTANLVKVFKIRGQILGKVDLQKTVYFMKRFGLDVPFEFRWNIFGPYSYDLAHYCASLEVEGLLLYSGIYSLSEEKAKLYSSCVVDQKTFEGLKQFFSDVDEICQKKRYDKVTFLECLASLDFINQNSSQKERRKENIFLLLQLLKPEKANIFKNMREDAWKLLQLFGLLS